jgi:hypothetical protein
MRASECFILNHILFKLKILCKQFDIYKINELLKRKLIKIDS